MVLTSTLALCLGVLVAQADAHGIARNWHRGFFGKNAVVTGTVVTVGTSSFTANAYVLTPGAGNSSSTPATTLVSIAEGPNTKIVVLGQSAITAGDTFYATYSGQSSTTPITTLASGTPSKIVAFVPPTPEVKVSGVVTAGPTTNEPDQFTATAYVVQPSFPGGPWRPIAGPLHGPLYGAQPGGGNLPQSNWSQTDGYSYGGGIGGSYGYQPSHASRAHSVRKAHGDTGSQQGMPNTAIKVDNQTRFDVNGNTSATVDDLAAGDRFTATFDGTPNEALSTIVADPALSVVATAGKQLYAFVGTVTGTDTVSTPETISVDVADSTPSGLFTGTDTFDVGTSTFVFGGANGSLMGDSLGNISDGDVVAGGLVSTGGQSASAIEADPLQVLVDFPAATTSSSSSSAQLRHAHAADLKRALKLLGKTEKSGKKHKQRHHKKH